MGKTRYDPKICRRCGIDQGETCKRPRWIDVLLIGGSIPDWRTKLCRDAILGDRVTIQFVIGCKVKLLRRRIRIR